MREVAGHHGQPDGGVGIDMPDGGPQIVIVRMDVAEGGHVKPESVGVRSFSSFARFTHHDSFSHVHLIASDKKRMSHLDRAAFEGAGMELFLADEQSPMPGNLWAR